MGNIINTGTLLLFCMFSLFFVPPGITYILAFLCALILCCTECFTENDRAYTILAVCFFAAALLTPDFLCFYPAAAYGFFRRRQYIPASAGALLCLMLNLWGYHTDPMLVCLELFGFLIGGLVSYETGERMNLQHTLRHAMDDSVERDLLLTEKNRTLLEKQDYEIYTATLKERNRIAREIHDNVGHLLSRSILLVGAAKAVNRDENLSQTLDSLDSSLNAAMDNIRSSVHDLRDDAVNLEDAIRSLIQDFTFCPVSYCYDAGRQIPREVKYSFISITKEALSNIMRHSNAGKAAVTVREHPALYQLCIEDDGTTADEKAAGSGPSEGMGLSNMRERTAKLNGMIHISAEDGFRILVTIPKRGQNYETDTD
nr:histidine kinase [uncultured Mediterraneibacter sp.]